MGYLCLCPVTGGMFEEHEAVQGWDRTPSNVAQEQPRIEVGESGYDIYLISSKRRISET
jgi:hypothetical protein